MNMEDDDEFNTYVDEKYLRINKDNLAFDQFEAEIQKRKELKKKEKLLKKKEKKRKRKEKKKEKKLEKSSNNEEVNENDNNDQPYKVIQHGLDPSFYKNVDDHPVQQQNDSSIVRDSWMITPPPSEKPGKYHSAKMVDPMLVRKVSKNEVNPLFNQESDLNNDEEKPYLVGDGGKSWREGILKSQQKKQKLNDDEKEKGSVIIGGSAHNPMNYFVDEKEKKKAMMKSKQKMDRIKESIMRCYFCYNNKKIPKHLIISLGNYTYLTLPERGSLVPYHLYIVPIDHIGSSTNMDDHIWFEVNQFMSCLTLLFKKEMKMDCLFMENVHYLGPKRHTYIECIPIPEKDGVQAPIFFKKAILESESEWAQHKKLYEFDVSSGGIRKTIPNNFDYFMVQFGMKNGYAHVIEERSEFSRIFGREVIGGMLKLPIEKYKFYQTRRNEEEERNEAKSFLEKWIKYDWTTQLDGGAF